MQLTKKVLLEQLKTQISDQELSMLQNGTETFPISEYNRKTIFRMMGDRGNDKQVPMDSFRGLKDTLTQYLSRHMPDRPDAQKWIVICCVYLALIKEEPMHPHQIVRWEEKDGTYFCPAKEIGRDRVCRYCVCQKAYKFYGWETAAMRPVSDRYPGIHNPCDLYDALDQIWCEYTCTPRLRERWNKSNKTLGACSVTAFLAQDIFGGQVYGIQLPGGTIHCFNKVGDCVFDLTSEQFDGEVLDYDMDVVEQFRDDHFVKEEKRLRYEYMKGLILR